jgi:hypothetical protein
MKAEDEAAANTKKIAEEVMENKHNAINKKKQTLDKVHEQHNQFMAEEKDFFLQMSSGKVTNHHDKSVDLSKGKHASAKESLSNDWAEANNNKVEARMNTYE